MNNVKKSQDNFQLRQLYCQSILWSSPPPRDKDATVEQDKVGTDNISSIFVSRTEMALAMLVLSVLKSVTDKALVANVFPMSPIVVKVVSPATGHMVFVSGY